jgi:hypothetical protein
MLLFALACVGPSDSAAPLEPAVQLGTGEWEWQDLHDEINVILGPQGGYHILGSVRTRGLVAGDPENLGEPTNPTTHFEVLFNDEDLIISSDYVQGLEPIDDAEWTHEMVGRFAILSIASDDELDGEDVLFRVTVTDTDGLELSAERTLNCFPDPRN